MIRLTLLACAPTEATRRAAFPADEPVTGRGAEGAAALRPLIARPGVAVSAPALRARQTAAAVGLDPLEIDAALRDLDYGAWAGATIAEIGQRDPRGLALWMQDPGAAPHGGESVAALCQRVADTLAGFESREGTMVAVTHAAPIRAAIVVALGAPLATFWKIDIAPLARVTLHGEGGGWRLRAIENSTVRKPA